MSDQLLAQVKGTTWAELVLAKIPLILSSRRVVMTCSRARWGGRDLSTGTCPVSEMAHLCSELVVCLRLKQK